MANEEHLAILKQGVEVWNEWREENEKIRPELNGSDLSRANLNEVNLVGADLNGADLNGADLNEADLSESALIRANLTGADLTGANLIRADLSRADLSRVNLTRAFLIGTNLNGANLSEANFDDVQLSITVFADLDLSRAQNLHLAKHRFSSTIGIDTLYKSAGNIPEVFLRGCGVPDTMITFAKSLVGKAIEYYSCFISYSTADEAFAKLLYDTLQGQGIRCWFAPEQILPGERIDSAIDYGIRYWDKVLFCASKSSLTEKWWVDFEVDKAFKKARDLQRERGLPIDVLIPLNLDGYLFSPEYDKNPKRSLFETILAADFVGWDTDIAKFNREVQKVIRAIRTDGGKKDPPPSKL